MSNGPKLFGTDGVRGVAGQYPLDPNTVWQLGKALGDLFVAADGAARPRVVLGEDTRESSQWISREVSSGLQYAGVEVVYAGVITTPGVAFLARHRGFAAGIMVSASHNPYYDNGIKVFAHSGLKLAESQEIEIELKLAQQDSHGRTRKAVPLVADPALIGEYTQYLQELFPQPAKPSGIRLVVDCAHGAASRVIPALLKALEIEAHILNASPDGRNINLCCGSLYPEIMAEATRSLQADLGVAFDGDADRAIFATTSGQVADGDYILYAIAPFFKRQQRLKKNTVVGTLMSNLGLEKALARLGIALERTAVGDKYVLEAMLRSGYNLGGEPSGHIIIADLSLAGDGIITLLQVLDLMAQTGKPFSELVSGLKQFPQVIRNVPVREKRPLESIREVEQAISRCRQEIGDEGRVIVRYSGTELLARVMVEAKDAETVERHAAAIAEAIESTIGLA